MIIDTPGVVATHRLPETIGDLAGFETFLVLPATFNPTTLRRLVELARPLVPTGVLLSHVDAVDSIGEVLSICRAEQLPFTWVGAGGELADGLESATANLLVDYATRSLAPTLETDRWLPKKRPNRNHCDAAARPRNRNGVSSRRKRHESQL